MKMKTFLEAVQQRYRQLQHYADHGSVHRTRQNAGGPCTFATEYQRGGTFKFSFSKGHPYLPLRSRFVSHWEIGIDSAGTPYFIAQYPGSEPERQDEQSLALAVAGATGISSGAAHTIGTLLFDEIGGMPLTHWKRLRFRRMRMVDGILCIAVSGRHPRGGRMLACFGADDLLLRRLQRKFAGGRRSEERRMVDQAVFTSASSVLRGIAA
jgi:hypothetical protein